MTLFNKDVLSGTLFVVVGAAGLWLGQDYAVGTAFRMGPGYFPRVLCGLLVLIGVIVALKGFLIGGEKAEGLHLWPTFMVTLAVVAFGGLIGTVGLLPAVLAVVFLGALGGPEFRLHEGILLAIVLTAAAIGIFKYGLSMTMPIIDLPMFDIRM